MGKRVRPTIWERDGATMVAVVAVHSTWRDVAADYVQHRLRRVRALPKGLLHPADVTLEDERLVLRFADGLLDLQDDPSVPFSRWREQSLIPALYTLTSCLNNGVVGFAPHPPVSGRWLPPVTWFLPMPASAVLDEAVATDMRFAYRWLQDRLRRREQPRDPDRQGSLEPLLDALQRGDLLKLTRIVRADMGDAVRRARSKPGAPSFLALLTEAELLVRVSTIYRYRLLRREEAEQIGYRSRGDERVLEVNCAWEDPHFPSLTRPSAQQLWDALVEESKTTPVLVISTELPNALARPRRDAFRVRWIGVHEDQPLLYVRPDGPRPPDRGFVRLDSAGDDTLVERKRAFTAFAGEHPAIERLRRSLSGRAPFVANPQPRDGLEEVILGTRGIFPVQGPPGTGKTHLATEVVRRFLARSASARVLVCAKEHFALDHILRKVTDALAEDGLDFRVWRSLSLARLRRTSGEVDTRWLANTVMRDLAGREWASEVSEWLRWQAATSEHHDQRLATLGQEAANLFFCTTMDAAMAGFIGKESFDLVIVEEAGKCYPSELLHTLCLGRTVLLIGDHRQLPPYQEKETRKGVEAWHRALAHALERQEHQHAMERRFGATFKGLLALARERGPLDEEEHAWLRPFELLFDRLPVRHRLEEQFRMEPPLSRLVGKVFYAKPFHDRKHELVERGLLSVRPLGHVLPPELDIPLLWIDTPHMVDAPEATEDNQKRGVRDNRYEHDVVLAYLRRLRPAAPIDMVILTAYNAQKSLFLDSAELRAVCCALTRRAWEHVVRTTDEYQGREAEMTVLSLVRNNSLGARAWGFMTELERLNVMFSRTRFRQVVVGCSAHIERHADEARWLHDVWKAYQDEARDPSRARIVSAREVLGG